MADKWNHWTDQFRGKPKYPEGVTVVTCTHAYLGVEQFYLSLDDFQDKLVALVASYWVNGYTIVLQPMD